MLVTKSTEQAVVALLMLAVQEGHTPVTGRELAMVMGVSESYLQKTMRKLVTGGLVTSIRTRDGGFVLAQPIDHISLGDVYRALTGDDAAFSGSSLAHNVFNGCNGIPTSEHTVQQALADAEAAFLAVLDQYPLSHLLKPGVWIEGARDWAAIAQHRRSEQNPRA